jgi:N-acetylglucosamine-6-phosphate deacetylase
MEGNIVSPGFIDAQINGAYGFDFSVYEGDPDAYRRGLNTIAEKIVETGVTSYVPSRFRPTRLCAELQVMPIQTCSYRHCTPWSLVSSLS